LNDARATQQRARRVACLALAEGDLGATTHDARLERQLAACGGQEMRGHVDRDDAGLQRGMRPRRTAQREVEHRHQGAAMHIATAVHHVWIGRQTRAAQTLFHMHGLQAQQAHQRNVDAEVRLVGVPGAAGMISFTAVSSLQGSVP
jgi:hypothetical protein